MTRTFFLVALALVAMAGCGASPGSSGPLKAPEFQPKDQAKCSVKADRSEPLIVEWPSTSRAKLESLRRSGLIAVRYSGCEMEVLSRCVVAAKKYTYVPVTRKHDRVHISDLDTLYAKLPVGALQLEGQLQQAGQLNVDMTIVGRYEAANPVVHPDEVEGTECAHATHVIAAITTGSFDFYAGAERSGSGGVTLLGAGAGAGHKATSVTINQDGDEKACDRSGDADSSPPTGCGAFLKLELAEITCADGSKPSADHACATAWDSALGAEARRLSSRPPETLPPANGDGLANYVTPIEINATTAKNLAPGREFPDAAVMHFWASLLRRDKRYQEVLPPPGDARAQALKMKLTDYVTGDVPYYVVKRVTLIGREVREKEVRIWARAVISTEGGPDKEKEGSTIVEKIDDKWCITRPLK